MKELDRVTLVIVDCKTIGQAVNSLQKSLQQIKPKRTILFTDQELNLPLPDVEIIKIETIDSKEAYSKWIIKELWKYIDTEFVLVTQWDSGVLNGDSWLDEFYEVDYLGSPWLYFDGRNMGNGGFSLRSLKLQTILGNDKFFEVFHPEDDVICRLYRGYLETKYKIKFADDELGDKFAYELRTPIYKTFGFHGFFHKPFQETIIISRKGAAGDVVALEPLLHYYYKKNYRVVLNTSGTLINLYTQHYFKIHRTDELDGRVKYREINLDLAYEVFPKQLHLKSYFQMCGIPENEWEIRNPKLVMDFEFKKVRLFDKYVVIHNDVRPQASRNITGVDWDTVCSYIREFGYEPIQIGNGYNEKILNATFMNTPSEVLLKWVVGGAGLFIGIDSLPSNVAVAMDTPAIIMSGSVDLRNIIPDMSNVQWIHNHDKKVCDAPFCWANTIGETGTPCYLGDDRCNRFETEEILDAIKQML